MQLTDVDRYGRGVGRVWQGQRDINREMLSEGHAWVYRRYLADRSLLKDEARARKARLGLWQDQNPQAPWERRRKHPR